MAVKRDLAAEQRAVGQFKAANGNRMPNLNEPKDRANLYRLAYPPAAGGLPDELKATVDQSLYSATGMASAADAAPIDALKAGVDTAAANVEKTSQPNEALRILQEAIRAKSGQATQGIGENPLFKELGVTGMGALSQSIASQGKKLEADFSNFQNIVSQMSGTYKDMATAALNNYKIAQDRYKEAADKITQEEKDIRDHAQAMELVNANFQNSLKLKQYEQSHPGVTDTINAMGAGLVQDDQGNWTKDTPIQMPSNSKIGDGVVTGYGSKLWGAGLDYALSGGKGAPVKSPFIGEVIWTGVNKGFGNQVKIRTTSGEEIWLSHLDSIKARVGDQVNEESIIGTQGNSGNTYGKTGVHVDVTMKKADGSYYNPEEVARIIGVQSSNIGNDAVSKLSPLAQQIYKGEASMDGITPTEQTKIKKEIAAAGLVLQNLSVNDKARVDKIVGQFDNEPLVKEYNTIQGNAITLQTLGNSPTDDMARIYAFAKVMDPGSAVKEGEYQTIQEYSTALLQKYGLKAKRVFSNTGFLTEQAREFINKTIESRVATATKQYKNVFDEYGRRVDMITNGNGAKYLTDYSASSGQSTSNNDPLGLRN